MVSVEINDIYLHIHRRMWTPSFERKELALRKLEIKRNNLVQRDAHSLQKKIGEIRKKNATCNIHTNVQDWRNREESGYIDKKVTEIIYSLSYKVSNLSFLSLC